MKFYQGIITGDNSKFLADKKNNNRYQKILRGRDIDRYYYSFNNNYILFDKAQLWSNTDERLYKEKEKLINRQTSDSLVAAYDDQGFFTLDSTRIQVLKNNTFCLKYVLSIFNSRLLDFCYKRITNEKGRVFAQVKTVVLKALSIKDIPLVEQQPFVEIVNKILAITKDEDYLENIAKQSKAREYERQIDQMVYELYGLTKEEIKIVEGINYEKHS